MDSPEQMSQQLQEIIDQVITISTTYGLNALGAVAILIIGWMAAGWAKSATAKALGDRKSVG